MKFIVFTVLTIALNCFIHLSHAATQEKPDKQIRALLKKTIHASKSFGDRFDAEVWYVAMSKRLEKFIPDAGRRLNWLAMIHREAYRAGIKPEIVLAVIEVESHFDRFAISTAGAQGLMQVMPFWKKELGNEHDNLINAEVNIRYGTTILSTYLKYEKGNLARALARYNGSVGKTWYPERVFRAWNNNWFYKNH